MTTGKPKTKAQIAAIKANMEKKTESTAPKKEVLKKLKKGTDRATGIYNSRMLLG